MKNTKLNNVKDFLNEIYSDLTNTSKQNISTDDLINLIDQFKELDLGTEKLEQLLVFVQNRELFGEVNIFSEVKKIVGKVLQYVNTPDFDVRRQMYLAVCQDVYDGDTKNFRSLHAQIKCLDADGSKGILSDFMTLIPGAETLSKQLKKLFKNAD